MRIVLGIIGSVMTLIVLATAAVVFFVDPNQWREPISDALSEQTGRPVAIDGSLNWQFFPRLGIDVGAVRIGSGAGFGDRPLLSAQGLSLGLEVMPLLTGEIALEALRIDTPQINLIRRADGQTNWQALGPQSANARSTEQASSTPPTWMAGFSLGGINLSNGEITLDDALNDQRLRAEQVNITLSALRLGQPSKLQAEARWVTAQQTQQAELRATITPNKNRSLAIRDTQLRLGDVAVDQLDADLKLTAQGLRVEPLSARFFDGDYQGDIQLITADAAMPARFDESLTGVAIGPLLAALTDIESLTGRGNVSLSGQINLAGADTALASLNGRGRLSIRDGAIDGVNIARTLRAAAARLEGRQPPAAAGPAQTDFTTLSASVVITNGIARTDDLALDSPLLRLRGRGQTNLDTQTLDLALEVNWVDTLEGQDGKALEALQGITIPARMTGRWSDPSIEIDVAEAIRQNQSEQLRERINQEVDSLRERLEGLFD